MKYEKVAISKFGKNYKKVKENELVFCCCKCNRNKLYVNIQNGVFHCFRCNYKGKLSARSSLLELSENYKNNISISNSVKEDNSFDFNRLKLMHFKSKPLTLEQTEALYNRGLSQEDIKYYNISGRVEDDRIQIPNYVVGCFTDVLCNWQYDKTKVTNSNPKYLISEGTKKSHTLFNIYNIEDNAEQIILCEGIFNAITAGKNAVASYGCSLSDMQCNILLSKKPKSILIAYDSDEPGVLGSVSAINLLQSKQYKGKVSYVLLPQNVDINDIGHNSFIDYVSKYAVYIDLSRPLSRNLPMVLYKNKL